MYNIHKICPFNINMNNSGVFFHLQVVQLLILEHLHHSKEKQPVHSKGDQSWVFFGRNDAKAETPILWPPHAKS